MTPTQQKVLTGLQNLCVKQECCRKDIYAKALKRLEGDAAAATEVLESLVQDKFVDDARYAAAFAREKAALTGWGPVKIRYALAAKGITADVAAEGLCEIEQDKAQYKLRRLLETKWRSIKEDPQAKLKLLKFALSRGYEYDAVKDLAEEIISSRRP